MRLLTAVAELNRAESSPTAGAASPTVALYTDPDADAWFVQEADEAIHLGTATYLDPSDGHRKSRYLDEAAVVGRAGRGLAATPSGSAGASCPSAPRSRSAARRPASCSSVRTAPPSGRSATRSPPSGWPRRPTCRSCRGAAARSTPPRRRPRRPRRLGYPVVLKATAGGGGRGIRVVRTADELAPALASARGEAELAFGDPAVFLERFVEAARHVEVQMIADPHGTIWAVGVRDCSIQRRNQKVIEESASTALDAETEAAIKAAAVRLAACVGYRNAGTVEFLVDPDDAGVPLHGGQRPAPGRAPGHRGDHRPRPGQAAAPGRGRACDWRATPHRRTATPSRRGCAPRTPSRASCRRPAGSRCSGWPTGSGVRVDSGVRECDTISGEFDSMIAKIVAWGQDRDEALARLRRALAQSAVVVEGGTTNRSFLLGLLDRPEMVAGTSTTAGWTGSPRPASTCPQPSRWPCSPPRSRRTPPTTRPSEAAFHAGARRGRPEMPETVGTTVRLRYAGATVRPLGLPDLARTPTGCVRGRVNADLEVDFVNDYERRVRCAGRVPPGRGGDPGSPCSGSSWTAPPTGSPATTAAWSGPGGRRSWSPSWCSPVTGSPRVTRSRCWRA